MSNGSESLVWREYRNGWRPIRGEVIEEALVTIYVNGADLATIMCTPDQLDALALGFLANEGLIQSLAEVDHVHVSQEGCCADVWLKHAFLSPQRRIKTSGCGGGVTFEDPSIGIDPLAEDIRSTPETLFQLFPDLHFPDSLHARARGVHAAALSDGRDILALAEDVGRHNTIDKLMGLCMLQAIPTSGRILLATGRVSSEMLHKGARMGCPIIASRNSPTSLSVALAQSWNITLIGYVRERSMRVYTHPERLTAPEIQVALRRGAGQDQEE